MTDAAPPRTPLWVRCAPCGHIWPAAYLPMPADNLIKAVSSLCCPMCAAGGDDARLATAADVEKARLPSV